ncbi:MAG: iron ABC transporter permease [Clostridia bacterium]|nr:iron ABC transporter permease [Clostridia bacterium]
MKAYQSHLLTQKRRMHMIEWGLLVLLILLILISVGFGAVKVPFLTTVQLLLGKMGWPSFAEVTKSYEAAILWDIRMPRVLIGALIGSGLAVAGCIFQAILKNPLADPYTIGVSTGAAFGGTLAIFCNLFLVQSLLPVPLFALAGAGITLMLVMKLSLVDGIRTKSSLILAGIIIGSILSAGISFLKAVSGEDVGAIIFWLMGNLSSKSWLDVLLAVPFIGVGILLANQYAMKLDIMTLGRQEAVTLGVDYDKTSRLYLVIASLLTAICVSVSGIIGFVGLVIPHLIRICVTTKNQYLLPISAIAGGIMLVGVDFLSRVLLPYELPVGILTTLLGGPFFIYIYASRKGGIQND